MPILNCKSTLNTPDGVLKLFHVMLGGVSIILIADSYVPYYALVIFLITIATCFTLSTANLVLNCFLAPNILRSKTHKIVGFIFHLMAGTSLILAGIDLIGWSDYDQSCGFKCPRIYYIGVAKILTFVNGTLYWITAFLTSRGEDEEDFLSESIPLLETPPPPPTILSMDGSYQEIESQLQQPHPHFSRSYCPSIKSVIN